MDDYPSNSQRQQKPAKPVPPEPKKVEKVVAGDVVRRKKPLGRKFSESFFNGDSHGVWNYIMLDVAVPAAKDMIMDMVSGGLERTLFGESVRSRRGHHRSAGLGGFRTDYNAPYRTSSAPVGAGRREEPRADPRRRARASHDFDDFILGTRVEAEEVIESLYELVSKYEFATVADLYELLGEDASFTDNKWGWMDLRGSGVTRVRNGGYRLALPRPEPLD